MIVTATIKSTEFSGVISRKNTTNVIEIPFQRRLVPVFGGLQPYITFVVTVDLN